MATEKPKRQMIELTQPVGGHPSGTRFMVDDERLKRFGFKSDQYEVIPTDENGRPVTEAEPPVDEPSQSE